MPVTRMESVETALAEAVAVTIWPDDSIEYRAPTCPAWNIGCRGGERDACR
jgi:hypothetical protein